MRARQRGTPSSSSPPLPCLKPQKLRQLVRVEADDRLSVDQRHRGTLISQSQQLFQCLRILAHILVRESHTLLRKKLFLSMTRPSAGLGENHHRFSHSVFSLLNTRPSGRAVQRLTIRKGGVNPHIRCPNRRTLPIENRLLTSLTT